MIEETKKGVKMKGTKRQTMIYKTLHIRLQMEEIQGWTHPSVLEWYRKPTWQSRHWQHWAHKDKARRQTKQHNKEK